MGDKFITWNRSKQKGVLSETQVRASEQFVVMKRAGWNVLDADDQDVDVFDPEAKQPLRVTKDAPAPKPKAKPKAKPVAKKAAPAAKAAEKAQAEKEDGDDGQP